MTPPRPPPRPAIAALLGFLSPGLGHLYAGSLRAAILFAVLLRLVTPLGMAVSAYFVPMRALMATVAAALLWLTLFGWQLVGGAMAARRHEPAPGRHRVGYGTLIVFAAVSFLYSGAVSFVARRYIVEPFRMPSAGMNPTIVPGDQFFVTKLGEAARVEPGAVVVFRSPHEPRDFVQRVIAMEGSRVEFRDELPVVDGVPLARAPCTPSHVSIEFPDGPPVLGECFEETARNGAHYRVTQTGAFEIRGGVHEVPAGHVFLLGDNRDNSMDSRIIGPVPLENIKGRARVVWMNLGVGTLDLNLGRAGVLLDTRL